LVDVPLSNAINANIHKNYIVTQYLSASLHRHIFNSYRNAGSHHGFTEILGAEQKPDHSNWYKGTADAIRQNLEYLIETPADYFLILSGDQLYHMDFQKMVQTAQEKDVDVLVATLPVNRKDARRMGIMKVNEDQSIVDFYEKPQDDDTIDRFSTSAQALEKLGLPGDTDRNLLGSMGIYLFKRSCLIKLLLEDLRDDFGKHLIPTKVKSGSIGAFVHDGYWEDIGTIESFYQANIALTHATPPFNLYNEAHPIASCHSLLPGTRLYNTRLTDSIICEGSHIEAESVANSILGQRTIIKKGTTVDSSYIMGNDFYHAPHQDSHGLPDKLVIEENCTITKAIIDKNVFIGKGAKLINKNNLREYDGQGVFIRDGIIVVQRGAVIPPGFVL
ncbi:MAG: glucose-1-phosphate adenylyltransferase, partial [Chlamydiales bacterium]|nr:glucose-1-phosphate adenylyltransferase [Chlamydiales bacterium]